VTLACKDAGRAQQCLDALERHGRPDAREHGCCSYDFGLELGSADRVRLIERWNRWEDLDTLLVEKVVPALPMNAELLAAPFGPATDTVRVELASAATSHQERSPR
jgi:hypothetical protein